MHTLNLSSVAGDATVTISHRYTPKEQLRQHTKIADIIVAAAGLCRCALKVRLLWVDEAPPLPDLCFWTIRDSKSHHRGHDQRGRGRDRRRNKPGAGPRHREEQAGRRCGFRRWGWSVGVRFYTHTSRTWGLQRDALPVSSQVWGRKQASLPRYLEVLDPWPWPCWWRTLSKQLRTFCCIPRRGFSWQLRPNDLERDPATVTHSTPTNITIPLDFYLKQHEELPLHMDWEGDSI